MDQDEKIKDYAGLINGGVKLLMHHGIPKAQFLADFEERFGYETFQTVAKLDQKEICSPEQFITLCQYSKYFRNERCVEVEEWSIPIGHVCFAITELHGFAEAHSWRTAFGTLILLCRHLALPQKEANPLPVLAMKKFHHEMMSAAELTHRGTLKLERHINKHPEDLDEERFVDYLNGMSRSHAKAQIIREADDK